MELRLQGEPIIDNLRNHSAATVEKLRALLRAGAPAQLDPRRKNFYELENCSKIYYVHVSPSKNKVMLLAVWDKDSVEAVAVKAPQEALAGCPTC